MPNKSILNYKHCKYIKWCDLTMTIQCEWLCFFVCTSFPVLQKSRYTDNTTNVCHFKGTQCRASRYENTYKSLNFKVGIRLCIPNTNELCLRIPNMNFTWAKDKSWSESHFHYEIQNRLNLEPWIAIAIAQNLEFFFGESANLFSILSSKINESILNAFWLLPIELGCKAWSALWKCNFFSFFPSHFLVKYILINNTIH